MKLFIRNMVCDRCRIAVRDVLDDMRLPYTAIHLGEADLGDAELDPATVDAFRQRIEALGFR